MIDIVGKSSDPRAARLSNFTERLFRFDGVLCAGIEGILQALKCPKIEVQHEICWLSGKAAKTRGSDYDSWKDRQLLWWGNSVLLRHGRPYQELLTRIYDTVYDQDPSFKADLLSTGYEELSHSIGKTDMHDTVLTEVEMLYHLNRLRIRALGDRQ